MTEFVIAEYGIRQLHARFADAVWRKDAEAYADCFAEDAEWKIATMHIRGRADIGGTFAKLLAACARVQIIAGTPLLEIGQGTATGRIQITELAKMADGSSAMTLGVYYDRYVEDGGPLAIPVAPLWPPLPWSNGLVGGSRRMSGLWSAPGHTRTGRAYVHAKTPVILNVNQDSAVARDAGRS